VLVADRLKTVEGGKVLENGRCPGGVDDNEDVHAAASTEDAHTAASTATDRDRTIAGLRWHLRELSR
jgi:hypothetical protein